MRIENHWLVKENDIEKFIKKPSGNAGDPIIAKYVIIHYTAGDTLSPALNWFLNTKREKNDDSANPKALAAHIIIDTDGTILQLIPFNRKANHSGSSVWDGVDGFNSKSIGIEIVNPGFVEKMPNGIFRRLESNKEGVKKYKNYTNEEAERIKEAKHKLKHLEKLNYWMAFTEEQIDAVINLSKLLFDKYQLINALGHDDVSPLRKQDPGPLFPWSRYKTEVLGKNNDIGKIFIVNSESDGFAYFRNTPSTTSKDKEKLSNGFEVGLIETYGLWSKVYKVNEKEDVLVKVDGGEVKCVKTIGWIFSKLLKLK
jgi:N-acetylmuramoyl-L-alanine amidase